MSPAQLQALKASIAAQADPTFLALKAADDEQGMANFYNQPSTFVVWRTSITEAEIVRTTLGDGTAWSWTAYIARSVGEQNAWGRLCTAPFNPSLTNVRQAVADIFSGATNGAPAQRTFLTKIAQRFATLCESLFATGTGTTATPGFLAFEGNISSADIAAAANS